MKTGVRTVYSPTIHDPYICAGPTRRGTRGTSYPGPVCIGDGEDESTHAKLPHRAAFAPRSFS